MAVRTFKQRDLLQFPVSHLFQHLRIRSCRQIQQLSDTGVHRDRLQQRIATIRKRIDLIHDQQIKTAVITIQLMHRTDDEIAPQIAGMPFTDRTDLQLRKRFLQTLRDLQYDLSACDRKADPGFPRLR